MRVLGLSGMGGVVMLFLALEGQGRRIRQMPHSPAESTLPTVALLTDLWPSRSEPSAGSFVRAEVAAVGGTFRHVVLVPRLRLRRLHEAIWSGAVQGWQRGWDQPPPPHRLLAYPMFRIPKGTEGAARRRGAARALRRAGETVDLVHGHFLFGVGPAAVSLARNLRVPSVLTAHGTDARWLIHGGVQERLRREMLESCMRADRLIVVSAGMADDFRALGVPAARVQTIPMGVDADLFRPADRTEARLSLGLDPDARIVLFVGQATVEKGFLVLEAALKSIEQVECIAIGAGQLTSPLVRRLGVVEPAQVARWLTAADVFCLPSLAEGMPVSVVEALASGRPVVATRVGGVPEQVEPGRNGFLVDPGDAGALAAALESALSTMWSPDELRLSSESFWWSTVGPRIAGVYEELMGG